MMDVVRRVKGEDRTIQVSAHYLRYGYTVWLRTEKGWHGLLWCALYDHRI